MALPPTYLHLRAPGIRLRAQILLVRPRQPPPTRASGTRRSTPCCRTTSSHRKSTRSLQPIYNCRYLLSRFRFRRLRSRVDSTLYIIRFKDFPGQDPEDKTNTPSASSRSSPPGTSTTRPPRSIRCAARDSSTCKELILNLVVVAEGLVTSIKFRSGP
jgi:hypothetical protein